MVSDDIKFVTNSEAPNQPKIPPVKMETKSLTHCSPTVLKNM